MTDYRIGCRFCDTNVRGGGITEASDGAGAIHSGGRCGAKAKGERRTWGAGKNIVRIAAAAAVGVAAAGWRFGALKTDLRLIRADQAVGAIEDLILAGRLPAKAHPVGSLIDAGHIVAGLAQITAAVGQLQLPAEDSQNCQLLTSVRVLFVCCAKYYVYAQHLPHTNSLSSLRETLRITIEYETSRAAWFCTFLDSAIPWHKWNLSLSLSMAQPELSQNLRFDKRINYKLCTNQKMVKAWPRFLSKNISYLIFTKL